jgi:hypothetical protein
MRNMIREMYRYLSGRPRIWVWSRLRFLSLGSAAWLLLQENALAQTTANNWTSGLQQALGIIMKLGFIAGVVMVIGGFLAARRDENWKMTVLYGVGVAGAAALMSVLFGAFGQGGAVVTATWGQ